MALESMLGISIFLWSCINLGLFINAIFLGLGGLYWSNMETVDEFPATSAVLLAAAFVIEDACKQVNDNFMECKRSTEDPADCVPAGELVQECANSVYATHCSTVLHCHDAL